MVVAVAEVLLLLGKPFLIQQQGPVPVAQVKHLQFLAPLITGPVVAEAAGLKAVMAAETAA